MPNGAVTLGFTFVQPNLRVSPEGSDIQLLRVAGISGRLGLFCQA